MSKVKAGVAQSSRRGAAGPGDRVQARAYRTEFELAEGQSAGVGRVELAAAGLADHLGGRVQPARIARKYRRDNGRCFQYGRFDELLISRSRNRGKNEHRAVVLGLKKIDWLKLQRRFESLCARSARRRPLLSERQGRKRGLLSKLQVRHSRGTIWDAGDGPGRVDNDSLPWVIRHDDPPIPGHNLERAVRRVFVRYCAII